MLAEHMPDVLIFDLKGSCESHVLPLLLENPHPTMIGLDSGQNQAVVLSGREAQSLALKQMRQVATGQREPRGKGTMGRRRQALRRAK